MRTAQQNLFGETAIPGVYEYRFDGPGQVETDAAAMGRQLEAVWRVMQDGCWRTLREICEATGYLGGPQSISARLRDLRKDRFGGYTVERRIRAGTDRVREYRVIDDDTDLSRRP